MSAKTEEQLTEIVINYLRHDDNGSTLEELANTATLHANVVQAQMPSYAELPSQTNLAKSMFAASLQEWVTGQLLLENDSVVSQLANVALELVDWAEVAESYAADDDQESNSIAA